MDVMPKDVPGELVRILQPIARVGGNVITVIHRRDEVSLRGNLPVHIVFEVEGKAQVDCIVDTYRAENIRVVKIDEVKCFSELVVGMIGHIVHTDLSETINSVDSLGFCKVSDMQIEMGNVKEESCAIFRVDVDSSVADGCKVVMSKIRETGRKKNIMIVESV